MDRKNGDLLQVAHSLAGGGGTFGYQRLSECASALETILTADDDPDAAVFHAALGALSSELERVVRSEQ